MYTGNPFLHYYTSLNIYSCLPIDHRSYTLTIDKSRVRKLIRVIHKVSHVHVSRDVHKSRELYIG